jgi:hypothetical protein
LLEALVVGRFGSESECSAVAFGQFGFCLDNAAESNGKIGLCSDAEERQSHELSEVGGGLPQAPLLSRCLTTIAVIETFGSGSEVIDERIAEGFFIDGGVVPQVLMVNSALMEVKVGGVKGCDFWTCKSICLKTFSYSMKTME